MPPVTVDMHEVLGPVVIVLRHRGISNCVHNDSGMTLDIHVAEWTIHTEFIASYAAIDCANVRLALLAAVTNDTLPSRH